MRHNNLRRIAGLAGLVLTLSAERVARGQAIGQGVELERAGQYDRAASLYFATLRADPTNLAALLGLERVLPPLNRLDRKSTRLNSSHGYISYAVFCLKKKKKT